MIEPEQKHRKGSEAPSWAVLLMGGLFGLLVITVIVGLIRNTLPATALATSLLTAITALATGLMARHFRDGGKP